MRLDKFLCDMGFGSRKDVKQIIKDKKVLVNGETAKKEMAYATLEGVVFSLYDIADKMNMPTPKQLVCGGGSAKNNLMAQIKAELFDCEVVRVKENDTSALGAVLIAMVGSGVFTDMGTAIEACVGYENYIKPSGKYREKLLKRFEIYRELYQNLKEIFITFNRIKEK